MCGEDITDLSFPHQKSLRSLIFQTRLFISIHLVSMYERTDEGEGISHTPILGATGSAYLRYFRTCFYDRLAPDDSGDHSHE
jgi:hypothetical protein